jgi:hypothetical protein
VGSHNYVDPCHMFGLNAAINFERVIAMILVSLSIHNLNWNMKSVWVACPVRDRDRDPVSDVCTCESERSLKARLGVHNTVTVVKRE